MLTNCIQKIKNQIENEKISPQPKGLGIYFRFAGLYQNCDNYTMTEKRFGANRKNLIGFLNFMAFFQNLLNERCGIILLWLHLLKKYLRNDISSVEGEEEPYVSIILK